MTKKTDKTDTHERKAAISQICDAESYIETITGCLTPEQAELMKPHHMANVMALTAELILANFGMIATAFERNNGLEVVFKARLASEKDTVEISFKPVDTYKDSASANVPNGDQEEFEFAKKKAAKAPAGNGVVVEAEVLCLPAPKDDIKNLPAPKHSETEEKAHQEGRDAFLDGVSPIGVNPYDEDEYASEHNAWREGWFDARDEAGHEAEKAKADRFSEKEERAYREGSRDFKDGFSPMEENNPYTEKEDGKLCARWNEGWLAAQAEVKAQAEAGAESLSEEAKAESEFLTSLDRIPPKQKSRRRKLLKWFHDKHGDDAVLRLRDAAAVRFGEDTEIISMISALAGEIGKAKGEPAPDSLI